MAIAKTVVKKDVELCMDVENEKLRKVLMTLIKAEFFLLKRLRQK